MWTYAQKSGNLLQDGQLVATGYSGFDEGKNNPTMQAVRDVGPIPQGDWTISGPPVNTAEHGPYVLTLIPAASTNTFNRSGFLMYGDAINAPGTASKGCIIMPRDAREQVWNSGDTALEVVPEFATQDLQGQNV
jgi:Protein of unknown function (DUF2778)